MGLPYLPPINTPRSFRHGVNLALYAARIGYLSHEFAAFSALKNASIKKPGADRPSPADFSKGLYTIDIGQNNVWDLKTVTPDVKAAQISEQVNLIGQLIQVYHYSTDTIFQNVNFISY